MIVKYDEHSLSPASKFGAIYQQFGQVFMRGIDRSH